MNPIINLLSNMLLSGFAREIAYLDPGSGSFILQIIIASAVGAAFAIRMYWQKITMSIKNLFSKSTDVDEDEDEYDDE